MMILKYYNNISYKAFLSEWVCRLLLPQPRVHPTCLKLVLVSSFIFSLSFHGGILFFQQFWGNRTPRWCPWYILVPPPFLRKRENGQKSAKVPINSCWAFLQGNNDNSQFIVHVKIEHLPKYPLKSLNQKSKAFDQKFWIDFNGTW